MPQLSTTKNGVQKSYIFLSEAKLREVVDISQTDAVQEEGLGVEPDPDVLRRPGPRCQLDGTADDAAVGAIAKTNLETTMMHSLWIR